MLRSGRSMPGENGVQVKDAADAKVLAPLYSRLPRGPHGLPREQVRHHQRVRIHGAMVEAVARCGYRDASVKQVIGLAGVSRRSFYEQFANKEDCFLATFDLIAQREVARIRQTYVSAPGGLEDRLLAVFRAFARAAREERNATLLVLVDAQTAGAPGTLRLRRATAACEEMLALGFEKSSKASVLPAPIVRAITGGLHGAVATRLRQEPLVRDGALAEEMLGWTLSFHTPRTSTLAASLQEAMKKRMREVALAHRNRGAQAPRNQIDARTRLLVSVLRLAAVETYDELTAPQIADDAGIAVDSFFEHFADRDACFLAALEMIGEELLAIASDPGLDSSEWPKAVRRVLRGLLGLLGANPLFARALIHESCSARRDTFEWSLGLSRRLAERLTAGSPQAPSTLGVDAVAGALWHTIRCQVASGRVPMLAALPDYLSYVVLSTCIGASAATELLCG
jgi:AcrR family transcriptional regulator